MMCHPGNAGRRPIQPITVSPIIRDGLLGPFNAPGSDLPSSRTNFFTSCLLLLFYQPLRQGLAPRVGGLPTPALGGGPARLVLHSYAAAGARRHRVPSRNIAQHVISNRRATATTAILRRLLFPWLTRANTAAK